MEPIIAVLYRPVGSDETIEYTTWSDVYSCPFCQRRIVYWEAVHCVGGPQGGRLECPKCGAKHRKADLQWIGEEPVESHTSSDRHRIDAHAPTPGELALIREADAAPIPYWVPTVPFGPEREMWRAAHGAMGITEAADFFTRRNLHALAALRDAISSLPEGERTKQALLFAFTAAVNRASRRYQWNAKRPTNVMTGTLYIPSLRYEWNVWSLFRRKAADVLRYYRSFPRNNSSAEVVQCSAAELDWISDSSIDMIFMDPPFGSNIFYSDSSLLWEAWLGDLTDQRSEIVVNKHKSVHTGGKSLQDYGELLRRSFTECARVLKADGRAVLAFSNSDDRVWQAVQKGLGAAGFETTSVHLLDKGQPSIKGVKGITGQEHVTTLDLVLCLERRRAAVQIPVPFPAPPSLIDEAIRSSLDEASVQSGRRTDQIYSAVIRKIVEARYSVAGITMPVIAARCADLGAIQRGGVWFPPHVHADSPLNDFVGGYLTPAEALPGTGRPAPVRGPIVARRVVGGRNGPFYLAHSYHTKVPPEAIQPFIEHYTKPGDVVLDPFCGSGMTGVAAALAGRRAILSDLSPAAIHLAWNHTRPCDPHALLDAFAAIEFRLAPHFAELYRTRHTDGRPALIHWTIWSARHRCTTCAHEFLLWDVVDRACGRLGKVIVCPRCMNTLRRSQLETIGTQPAWIAYETEGGQRFEKPALEEDLERALSFRRDKVDGWYPTTPLANDREMYIRCALQLHGVSSVADLYTPRNLQALALIWREISTVRDERIRRALAFAFTNTAWHGTRMRRFNARGGQRPLTGTLYIPQLSSEANVLEIMRNKINQLQRYYRSYRPRGELPAVLISSATDLSTVPNESIDYVFTDPPFGSNIFYSDCNLVWEFWLGRLTNASEEAVINRSLPQEKGGKSLSRYAELMNMSMREIARILKPSAWATVVFHNTDANVWQAICDAAGSAGFAFREAVSLDRRQQSHKGYKGRSGAEDVAHFDVIFNLQKPAEACSLPSRSSNVAPNLAHLVASILRNPDIVDHGLQGVHSEVMRCLASTGSPTFVDYADVRTLWEQFTRPAFT